MGKAPSKSASPPPASPAADSPPKRALSRKRLWLFRFFALALPLLLLAGAEGVCRVAGVGRDLSLVVPASGDGEPTRYRLNDAVDMTMYGATNIAGPEPREFRLPKPPGVYRIVVLGGSTVFGFPYPAELSFPRQMELILSQQEPETTFEVLNAGITSMNSFFVADLARQCLECDPDLIVIHAGHNEFYGPGGPASNAFVVPPRWMGTVLGLRRLRISQGITALLPSSGPAQQHLLDALPRTLEIPIDSDLFRQAEANYRQNLAACLETASSRGVPVLLSTVACNLRDQSPMRSLDPRDTSEPRGARWKELVEQAEAHLISAGSEASARSALQLLNEASEIDRDSARLEYRKGQCYEALAQPERALAAYTRARDLDACRFRAPSSFETICREVAEGGPGEVAFLDVGAELQPFCSPYGPGTDLFLEHVHYNLEGHRKLGLIFARAVQERVRGRTWSEDRLAGDQELDRMLGIIPEDVVAGYSFGLMTLDTAPLRGALDARRQKQWMTNRIAEAFTRLDPVRREAFADVPMDVMSANLIEGLRVANSQRGNREFAEHLKQLAAVRRPWEDND